MNQRITTQCVCWDLETWGLKEAYCFSPTYGISFTDHGGTSDRWHRPIQVPQLMEHFLLGWRRGSCFKDSRVLCGVTALYNKKSQGEGTPVHHSAHLNPPKLIIYTMGWNFKKLFHQWRFLGHPLRNSSGNSMLPMTPTSCAFFKLFRVQCKAPPILLSTSSLKGQIA